MNYEQTFRLLPSYCTKYDGFHYLPSVLQIVVPSLAVSSYAEELLLNYKKNSHSFQVSLTQVHDNATQNYSVYFESHLQFVQMSLTRTKFEKLNLLKLPRSGR